MYSRITQLNDVILYIIVVRNIKNTDYAKKNDVLPTILSTELKGQ